MTDNLKGDKTRSKISLAMTEFMAGHPKLVAVVLGLGVTFVVAAAFSVLVGSPHEAFAGNARWNFVRSMRLSF